MERLFPDAGHPYGVSPSAFFSLRDDKLYPDVGHPEGVGIAPWFSIRGDKVYRDRSRHSC